LDLPKEIITKSIPRAALGVLDLPGDIAHLVGEGEKQLLSLADKYLPGAVSSALRTASEATAFGGPVLPAPPAPGHFRGKVEESELLPAQIAEFGADVAIPANLVGKARRVGQAIIAGPPEVPAATRVAGEIKKSGMHPESIKGALGLEDVRTAVPGFNWRFPSMNKYGVKNADEAAKTAGEMYDAIPNMRGFKAELSVTAKNPRTGQSYGDAMEEALISADELLIPPALRKLLLPGAGPFTVADRYKAARALRNKIESTSNYAQKKVLNKYLRLLKDLEPTPGQSSEALDAIRESDKLYSESMRLRDVSEGITEASKKGREYTVGLVQQAPKVKATQVLKELDQIGDEKLFKLFGERYKTVKDALSKIGKEELSTSELQDIMRNAGLIEKMTRGTWLKIRQFAGGGVGDWRVLSYLFPGEIVGSAPYHAAKAIKKTLQ
jgi:hypothetical protein